MNPRTLPLVIRKQKPKHAREGQPLKWCAACRRCSRAIMTTDWTAAIAWVDVHPAHCGARLPAGFALELRGGPVFGPPPTFTSYGQAAEAWRALQRVRYS